MTQNLTILFADISESTKLYNTLGDSGARVVVNSCLTLMSRIAAQYSGRVVKTMGDEIVLFQRADDAIPRR